MSGTLPPGLYLVATPIGNLGDITARAVETLKAADVILCEDSRITGRLTRHYGIKAPLRPFHEHNAARLRPMVLAELSEKAVALVSDAGTPLVSDPGYKLVRAARAAGHLVTALPGPNAAVTALVVSGLPTDRFLFAGFSPNKKNARRAFFTALADIDATLVVYESARRLGAALEDAARSLGDREAAVCRELTKLHEEVRGGTLSDLAAHYRQHTPKGEIVLVVAGRDAGDTTMSDEEIDSALIDLLKRESVKDAAAALAAQTGLPRKRLYARALALKNSDR